MGDGLLRKIVFSILAGAYRLREALASARDPRPEAIPLNVSSPLGLGIEVTNLCNANCVFCGYQYRNRPVTFMPQETFERAMQQYVSTGGGGIGLTPVVGDPLIDKGLVAKIAYARSLPEITDIGITTNAILLSRQLFDEFVDAGLTEMTISMSGFDPEEYQRVYRNPSYKKVISNLHAIVASHRFQKCHVSISLRTDSLFPWLKPEYWRLRFLGFKINRNMFFDNWSDRIKDEHLSQFMFLRPQRRSKRIPCFMLYGGPQILADGRMTACGCRDLEGTSELALGNIWETTIGTAWQNGKMESLRRRFVEGNLPDICRNCTHYTPVNQVDHWWTRVLLITKNRGRESD